MCNVIFSNVRKHYKNARKIILMINHSKFIYNVNEYFKIILNLFDFLKLNLNRSTFKKFCAIVYFKQ